MVLYPYEIEALIPYQEEFEKNEWLKATMSKSQLKRFLKQNSYEFDFVKLPSKTTSVYIGYCGGVKYFEDGKEVIIAENYCPYHDEYYLNYAELRMHIVKWLLIHGIEFEF